MPRTVFISLLVLSILLQRQTFAGFNFPHLTANGISNEYPIQQAVQSYGGFTGNLAIQPVEPSGIVDNIRCTDWQEIIDKAYDEAPKGSLSHEKVYELCQSTGKAPDEIRNYIRSRRIKENKAQGTYGRQKIIKYTKFTFSADQKNSLKEFYARNNRPLPEERKELAINLRIPYRVITNYFNNTRHRKRIAHRDNTVMKQQNKFGEANTKAFVNLAPEMALLSRPLHYTGTGVTHSEPPETMPPVQSETFHRDALNIPGRQDKPINQDISQTSIYPVDKLGNAEMIKSYLNLNTNPDESVIVEQLETQVFTNSNLAPNNQNPTFMQALGFPTG